MRANLALLTLALAISMLCVVAVALMVRHVFFGKGSWWTIGYILLACWALDLVALCILSWGW